MLGSYTWPFRSSLYDSPADPICHPAYAICRPTVTHSYHLNLSTSNDNLPIEVYAHTFPLDYTRRQMTGQRDTEGTQGSSGELLQGI